MILKNILYWIFLCLLFSLSYGAKGQTPYFKSISLLKSRQDISVNCIFQGSTGYLWASTSKGLIRYDGMESYLYGTKDSINPSVVTAICEDSAGQIWIGHKNGSIEFLVNNCFRDFSPEEGLGHSEISFIKFDSKGSLWFGTLGEGVYYYQGQNRKRIKNINSDDGLLDNYVYTFAESGKNMIYLGTDNGISVIDGKTNQVTEALSMKNGLPDNIVRHVELTSDKLWIGMDEKGVCVYDIPRRNFITIPGWDFGALQTFTLETPEKCWISTKDQGILIYSLENNILKFVKKHVTIGDGKTIAASRTVYSDREKNIWIGTADGLVLLATSAFEFIEKKIDGFDFGSIFSFIADAKSRFWAATQNGLYCISYDKNNQISYTKILSELKEVQNAFISLYMDAEGYIWAGTYGYGAYRINPENLDYTKYDMQNGLPDNNILYITGKGNKIWFATAGGGAAMFDPGNPGFQAYNQKNGLKSNYLYAVFIDSKGNVWFALDGKGVSVLKEGKLYNDFLPDSFGVNTVYAISESLNGTLWFLTSDKGLLRYNGKSFQIYNETNGLLSDNVRSIIADKPGNLVITSNEGIQLYISQADAFETFAEERGIAFKEPNINGISSDSNGSIWIATRDGVIKYTPVPVSKQNILPKIMLSKKLLFLNPFDQNLHDFSYNQNHFTFEYTGFWFQSCEKLLYRYKLENYDFDWSLPTNSRLVTYSNLPPGQYTFTVEVSHLPGIWTGNKNATFSFTITPPFYKTWWFISISICALLFLIYYFIKSRTEKLQRAKEELEIEVKKRTSTIFRQKEEIEAQRDEMEIQRNTVTKQKEEIESQRDFVIAQRDQISMQNKQITLSIQYAGRIQQAILPPEEELDLRLKKYFILNRPMDIVSGDFYWTAKKNKRTYLVVADCTGHGVSGAFMSVLGVSLLNKIIFIHPELSAASTLDLLRDEIKYALRQTGKIGEAQDGMDIFIIILENDYSDCQYAGANSPAYLFRDNELLVLNPDKMPIGIYPNEKPFTNNTIRLNKNDMLYLCSDGYKDQFDGQNITRFQSKKFRELLTSIANLPLPEQKKILNNTMDDWKAGQHQNDDILVLGFKI